MKILLIDGTYDNSYAEVTKRIKNEVTNLKHELTHLKVSELKIAYCCGCFGCWVKTPGKCCHNDDTQRLLREQINTDLIVHITENKFGSVTSLTKKCLDKSIPLTHPYVEVVKGESCHRSRYDSIPNWSLIVIDPNEKKPHFELIKNHFNRAVENAKTGLVSVDMLSGKEVDLDEINFTKWITKG